jgi:predicted nucleic acid-binding protein
LKLVLDTNIYCDFVEGLPDAVDAIATYGQTVFIPSVVLGELFWIHALKADNPPKPWPLRTEALQRPGA